MNLPLRDPLLLTPGPATTTIETKAAMLRDWGSWDTDFIALNARILTRLLAMANAGDDFVCVPLQGSGSFGVEATVGTLLPRDGHLLVLVNGAYGRRMAQCVRRMGRAVSSIDVAEDAPTPLDELDRRLTGDAGITHVGVIHCETSTGILNPLEQVAGIVARHGRRLIVDAMSSFGALPIDLATLPADAVIASANKCIEGVPGMSFALLRRAALETMEGNAHSLCLDLHDQWHYMARTGQWRYTPPTHVLAAFDAALAQHGAEGGVAARGARYARNCEVLVSGMQALGFAPLLTPALRSPIIVTFCAPDAPGYDFQRFYGLMKREGFIIYPGKLTARDTFRIGCIGAIGEGDMRAVCAAAGRALREMGAAGGYDN